MLGRTDWPGVMTHGISSDEVVKLMGLQPLPGEGGYYRRTWSSDLELNSEKVINRYGESKSAGSAIYYMLTDDTWGFSALHSLPTDEIYHFYGGNTVELWLFSPLSGKVENILLGNRFDKGEVPQYVVPAGTIQGSRLRSGSWALLGTTMAPAYTDRDFILADREDLLGKFPEYSKVIGEMTRSEN